MSRPNMKTTLPESTASTGVNSGDTAGREVIQLPLRFDGSTDIDGAWSVMLQTVRGVVDRLGLKDVAYDLDVSPSYLSHCLNERERHNVPAKWIPYLILRAKDDRLPAFLAALRGCELKPIDPVTPEEKCRRYERMFSRLGRAGREMQKAALEGDE